MTDAQRERLLSVAACLPTDHDEGRADADSIHAALARIAELEVAVRHARGYFVAHAEVAELSSDGRARDRADHLRHHAEVMDAALKPPA